AMIIFAAILAAAIQIFRRVTGAAADTVVGVFFAATIALGVALLSRGGGFSKFTVFLVGDILSVTAAEIIYLASMLAVIVIYWIFAGNAVALISVNPSLARSRGIKVFLVETTFSVLVAVVVIISIKWVGILIINSLFILPAAASRLISGNIRGYTFWSVFLSILSGVSGLIISFYWGTACGATIVLCAALLYAVIVSAKGGFRIASWRFSRR
ncbi:MAG: metal ABC transporter permease, partial [Spirochaetota bacterium]